MSNYWWCRTFKFIGEGDESIPIDEFYLIAETLEDCKNEILKSRKVKYWSKPKKEHDDYLKIMKSEKYYYDLYIERKSPVNDICYLCHKKIEGIGQDYYRLKISIGLNEKRLFCSHVCMNDYFNKKMASNIDTSEWQSRTNKENVQGYIYHIYNKRTHKHYVGQTKYMPFFRWQEHAKTNKKGDIEDLVFETICEVSGKEKDLLSKAESHWINQYITEFGKDNVINEVIPKFDFNQLELDYQNYKTIKVD